MFYIKIAKLLVQVNNHYDLIRQQCQPYLVEPHREPDLVMEADEKEIAFGKAWFLKHEHTEITDAASEFSRAPYTIYPQLPQFDALWLHSAVMEMDGEGYAVTAPSGYGKTTQARLWLKAFPGKARIINGDNPIVRKEGGRFYGLWYTFLRQRGLSGEYRRSTQRLLLPQAWGNQFHSADGQHRSLCPASEGISMSLYTTESGKVYGTAAALRGDRPCLCAHLQSGRPGAHCGL